MDHQLFGDHPGAFHAVNLAWHVASVVLLYVSLSEMSGDRIRSLVVAAVFGIHPLHVESVAWISERKDVLSGFFWMLGLWSYSRWHRSNQAPAWWLCVTCCITLGLMAKQIVVMLPFIFLLLDVWPLRRVSTCNSDRSCSFGRDWAVAGRKASVGFCPELWGAAMLARHAPTNRSTRPEGDWPLTLRLSNAVISVFRYLFKSIYPIGLSVQYPYDPPQSMNVVVVATIALAVISLTCLMFIRRRPAIFVGWFWFLATLIPVIGFIQLGKQSMADRYLYLPLIGISIAVVWSVPTFKSRAAARRLSCMTGLCVATLTVLTAIQAGVWRNSDTLYGHAIAIDPTNEDAHYAMSTLALESGDLSGHLAHLRQGIEWDRKRSAARETFARNEDSKKRRILDRRWSQIFDDWAGGSDEQTPETTGDVRFSPGHFDRSRRSGCQNDPGIDAR